MSPEDHGGQAPDAARGLDVEAIRDVAERVKGSLLFMGSLLGPLALEAIEQTADGALALLAEFAAEQAAHGRTTLASQRTVERMQAGIDEVTAALTVALAEGSRALGERNSTLQALRIASEDAAAAVARAEQADREVEELLHNIDAACSLSGYGASQGAVGAVKSLLERVESAEQVSRDARSLLMASDHNLGDAMVALVQVAAERDTERAHVASHAKDLARLRGVVAEVTLERDAMRGWEEQCQRTQAELDRASEEREQLRHALFAAGDRERDLRAAVEETQKEMQAQTDLARQALRDVAMPCRMDVLNGLAAVLSAWSKALGIVDALAALSRVAPETVPGTFEEAPPTAEIVPPRPPHPDLARIPHDALEGAFEYVRAAVISANPAAHPLARMALANIEEEMLARVAERSSAPTTPEDLGWQPPPAAVIPVVLAGTSEPAETAPTGSEAPVLETPEAMAERLWEALAEERAEDAFDGYGSIIRADREAIRRVLFAAIDKSDNGWGSGDLYDLAARLGKEPPR